jgi:hypothetical protein
MANDVAGDDEETPEQRQLVALVTQVISHVANEPLLLTRYEHKQADTFARLWAEGSYKAISERLDKIVIHLGGPPRAYLLRDGESPPPEDGFPGAALQEVLSVFQRARTSVIRAHMFHVGNRFIEETPGIMAPDPKAEEALLKLSQEAFWEHAEAAYIRLSSYWDRVGQVLNFAFFNIRSFKQEGFQSVMDRIDANVAKMDAKFAKTGGWTRLRSFQTSAKEDCYKWLQERRNLVIHSLHLQPIAPNDDSRFDKINKSDNNTVFTSQFNHLDHAHREKLRPRDPNGEVALLMGQLGKAADLFNDLLALLEASPSKMHEH